MDDVLTAIAMCVCFDPDSDSDDTCKKCKKPVKQKQAEVYRANIIAFKYATNDKKEGIVVAVNPVSSSVKLGIKVIKRRFVIAGALVSCEPFLKRLKRHIQEIQQNRAPVVDDLFTFIAHAKADGNQKKPKYPAEKKFFEDPSLIAGFNDMTPIIMPYDDGERHVLDVCAIGGDKDAVEAKLTDVCRDKMTKKEAMKRGRQMIYWVTERMPTSESHYCVHIGPKKVGKVKIVTRATLGQEFQSGIEPQSRQKQPLRRISGQKSSSSPSKSSSSGQQASSSASGSGQQASGGASGSGEQPSNSAGNNQQPPDDNEHDSSSESDQESASSSDDDQDSSEPEPEEPLPEPEPVQDPPPEPEPDQEQPPINGAFGGANGENDPWNAEENVNPDDQPPPDNLPPPQPGIQPPPPPDNGLAVIQEEGEDADDEMEDEQIAVNGVVEGVAPLAVAEEDLDDESEAEAEAQLQVEPEQNGDLDAEGSDNVFDD